MKIQIRKWEPADAKALAFALSNKKVQDNLRDGLPYPYTEQDGKDFISAMLAADENDTFAFATTVDGKVAGSNIKIDVNQIPEYQREQLAQFAIELTRRVFARPGEEDRYQAWLYKRQKGKKK